MNRLLSKTGSGVGRAVCILGLWAGGFSPTGAMESHTDIAYLEGGDPRQVLDIHRPDGAGARPAPALVYVHGGGWVSGDKTAEAVGLARYFAERGYATVALNYRLAPGVGYREQAADVAAALGWVVKQGHRYGLDTDRLYLAGGSAGAHLAAQLVFDPGHPGHDLTRHLRGVVLISGIYDVRALMEPGMRPTRVERVFGTDPALHEAASPVAHLARHTGPRPPLLVSVTDHDLFGLQEQAMRFYSLLLRSGWPVELLAVPDRSHYNQFRLGERTPPLDERFVPDALRDRLRVEVPATVPDVLGPAVARFLDSVGSGQFVADFRRAWPSGWPTGGFNASYTMSAPLPDVDHEARMAVPYGQTPDPLRSLDIYIPCAASPGPRPILFYIHGGGFRAGDKAMVEGLRQVALNSGLILVSTNYRLSPAVTFPTHARDVAQALAWVYRNAENLGGDRNRLAVAGISAGAHLAAITALDGEYLREHGLEPGIIRAVLAISGIYDLEWFREPGVIPSRLAQAFADDPELLRRGSPQRFARAAAPPFLLTFTDADLFLIREGTYRFATALRQAGAAVEVVELLGRDHFNQQVGIGRQVGFHEDMLGPVITRFAAAAGLVADTPRDGP